MKKIQLKILSFTGICLLLLMGCSPNPIEGKKAPAFELDVIDYSLNSLNKTATTAVKERLTLDNLNEKPIILYFFASW